MSAGWRPVVGYVAAPRQLGGQLEALRFAAREGRQRLAEAQIPDAHVDQELQAVPRCRRFVCADSRLTRMKPTTSATVISSTSWMERPW